MADQLLVYHGIRRVGTLTEEYDGRIAFAYAPVWLDDERAFAISVSLPLVPGLDAGRAEHAFFANLLPEGNLREAVARRLGISGSNDFALLRAIGGECAGALTILPCDTAPNPEIGDYERLEPGTIARMARRYSVLAEVTGQHRPRLSLAGAQDKLPVKLDDDGSVWLPLEGAPSTHILKVPSRDFKHLPANEVLISRLASRLSLVAVEIELLCIEELEIAVVRRYDRTVTDGVIARLHQEDMCQGLGLMPGRKYEQEGGPGFGDVWSLIRATSSDPLADAVQLLRWLPFVLLAGNADAHGKNLSLLYVRPGVARLAPFYDLICTRVYERVDRLLAMRVGGQQDPGLVGLRHWENLAAQVGVGKHLVLREVEKLATEMPTAWEDVVQGYVADYGDSPVIQRIRRAIRKQCRRTLELLRRTK